MMKRTSQAMLFALVTACASSETTSMPEPEVRVGFTLHHAERERGILATYVTHAGLRLDLSAVQEDGAYVTEVQADGRVVAAAVLGPGGSLWFDGVDLRAVADAGDAAALARLLEFRHSEVGVALMELPIVLDGALGGRAPELGAYTRGAVAFRMALELLSGEPAAMPVPYATAAGAPDGCDGHGAGYVIHPDGTFDSMSDDISSSGARAQCFGCCGPSCWGCTGVYTEECAAHDACVASRGHFLCLGLLGPAISSYLREIM